MKKNLTRILAEITKTNIERIESLPISKTEFCRLAGISRDTLRKLDNPTIATLQRIEKTLNELGV